MATNKSRESMEINTKKVVEPRPHSQVLQARPNRYPIIVTDLEKSIGDFAAMLGVTHHPASPHRHHTQRSYCLHVPAQL